MILSPYRYAPGLQNDSGDDEERARMTMVGIGGARSDANEANDMQKLVFVYLSR